MEFGKVSIEQLAQIDFTLPVLPAGTLEVLSSATPHPEKEVYVGCPIWANKAWAGKWYPAEAKEKDFLKYYASQFNTIELNSTHYQIPHPSVVESWREKVGKDFRFCPKFLQEISHSLLPECNAQAMTKLFCDTMRYFGENLGISFLQLSPYFASKERDALLKFLDALPADYRLAVEFRHESWFSHDALPTIIEELKARQIGTILTDTAGRRDAVHLYLSMPVLMLRFLGNNLHDSDYDRVEAWVGKIHELIKEGLQEIYFFAHEPDNTLAPELACHFIQRLAKVCHIHVAEPKSMSGSGRQVGLF